MEAVGMHTLVRQPTGLLRMFVDGLFYIAADRYNLEGLSLPMSCTELMFNFSDHFVISRPDETVLIRNESTWVSGLQNRPLRSSTVGKHETFGALLKPWALQPLTGVPAAEFSNQAFDSRLIFGADFNRVAEGLQLAGSPMEKLTALEAFLTARYADKDLPAYLFYAVDFLQSRPWHDGIVAELSRELRISRKTLTLAFRKYVGLTPGRFLHLLQYTRAIEDLAQPGAINLTELSHRHSFYDQSHFIHVFKSFTGMTPGAYRRSIEPGIALTSSPYFIV